MEVFRERRRRVLADLDGVALLLSAPETIRNHDVHHAYRQDSDLFYLTGFEEPESILVLSSVHPEHRSVLFVRERDPEREVWDGARAGVEGVKVSCGVDASFPISQFEAKIGDYLAGADTLHYVLGQQPRFDAIVLEGIEKARARGRSKKAWPQTIRHPQALWHEMRLIKSEVEIDAMRRAATISAEAHCRAMAACQPGMYEYEIEAVLKQTFLSAGAARVAYNPIVGSGPNATVLHYVDNRRQMQDGELLLIDAGCEYAFYAADITRTFPVNGRFTAAQRQVYEVVLGAQDAAIAETKVGSNIDAVHEVAREYLVRGMVEMGLLEGDVATLIADESYKRYYMHRTSHWLGMDVHDVGAYYVGGDCRAFEPGMVITVEPGIYIAANDEKAPEAFRGIGVRIEDDILVTEDGNVNLTADVPRKPDEIERVCLA
jgi:Xaa-Pro aminopeptidase